MKRIHLKIILAVFVIAALSCSDKDLLDQEPFDTLSEDVAFDTPDNIELAVTGMYEQAAIGNYNGTGRGYIWGAAWAEQNDAKGEDMVNTVTFFQQTYLSQQDPSGANSRYYWEDGYNLINKANLVIEGVTEAQENGIISEDEMNDYIGQARFMRGITHFELLIQFARPYSDDPDDLGVPYRDTPVNSTESMDDALEDDNRKTIQEVYDKVLEDLDFAEDKITTTDLVRASSNAAIAFKTRVYLNMRDWPSVISEAHKLEGQYEIEDEPSTMFTDNSGNSESIFSIDQDSKGNAGVNGGLPNMYNDRELLAISPIIWNNEDWLEDDKRRAVADDPTDPDDPGLIKDSNGTLYSAKYKRPSTTSDLSPIMRYAEVKLNLAEAEARQNGVTSDAVGDLNDVRDRSLADPDNQTYDEGDFDSDADLVQSVILERRIEFLAEGHRWGDIQRLQNDDLAPVDGIPSKHSNGDPDPDEYDAASGNTEFDGVSHIDYDDFRFVWPIPNSEMNVNDNIKQNPGY